MRTFRVSDDVVIVPEMVAGVRIDEGFGPVWRVSVILPMGGEAVVAQFTAPIGGASGYLDERGMVHYHEYDQAAALAARILEVAAEPAGPVEWEYQAVWASSGLGDDSRMILKNGWEPFFVTSEHDRGIVHLRRRTGG